MSGPGATSVAGVKRKRIAGRTEKESKTKSLQQSSDEEDTQALILRLESQILESRRHLNNIATLLRHAQGLDKNGTAILAVVTLCRVFSRFHSGGDMVKSKGMAEAEVVIVQWLRERYREYLDLLLVQYLRGDDAPKQSVALTLLMQLVKQESQAQKEYNWKHGPLPKVIETALFLPPDDPTRDEFVEKYFQQFDDIRFFTFRTISHVLKSALEEPAERLASANVLSLLLASNEVPASTDDLTSYLEGTVKQLKDMRAYKTAAQEAWLETLRRGLNKEQRKTVLGVFSHQIAPWFPQPEMLMDFLTDSYNAGGATSLLALSGLFYLISERNLDYPSFYQKLYSLLDEGLLHSKHRSRFFRLLDTFMSSTHLPAALVASFIKRLARLALYAPPAGIVVVVPWIYNMFKKHPACTFMIHRETRDLKLKKELENAGMDDPFDMSEEDPMLTEAIESSLWEIEALQSHYHPNVATLAKIISEQFTKRSYNLEDFLDHSYSVLLDAELGRELKKEPVVEYEIPKRIFTNEESGLGTLGQLMMHVVESGG